MVAALPKDHAAGDGRGVPSVKGLPWRKKDGTAGRRLFSLGLPDAHAVGTLDGGAGLAGCGARRDCRGKTVSVAWKREPVSVSGSRVHECNCFLSLL